MEKYRINPISGEITPINTLQSQHASSEYNSITKQTSTEKTAQKEVSSAQSKTVTLPNTAKTVKISDTENERSNQNQIRPGAPGKIDAIPKTAPSRQRVPKVPNRAFTEMSISPEQNDTENEEKEIKNDENGAENGTGHDKSVTTKAGSKLIKTIVIAGQIEGHNQLPQGQKATRYEELIPQLVEIEESDEIGGLLLILNTVGGDVEAGLALSELISGMKKPTATLVLGGGHSIGVPLAVSAKRSFIVPSATMTLHPVRITGMVLGAPQTYVYMSRMQKRIVDFTCDHCNITPQRFNELMLSRDEMSTDLGSVLDGKQAVGEGLIDRIGTLSDAIGFLRSCIDQSN